MTSLNRPYRLLMGASVLAAAVAASQSSNAASFLWNVATPGANDWNVSANWSPNTGTPGAADTAIFGSIGTGFDSVTPNNVVSADTTVAGLSYTNATSGAWHVTQIPAPNKLTVTGNFTVGGLSGSDSFFTSAAMVGDGTLEADGNSFRVANLGSSSSSQANATFDMSGLSNFVYNAPAGTWVVAGSGSDARGGGVLNLAGASNNITVGTINFNTGGGNNSGFHSLIQLGSGTNIFNVNSFVVAQTKAKYATVQFFPGVPATAGLRIRGTNGNSDDTSRANITLGDRNNTGSQQTDGEMLLNGYPVDIKADTLTIGQDRSNSGSSQHNGIGVLQFDTGTVDANTINMAIDSSSATSSSAQGTLTVGANGTLIVGTNGILGGSVTSTGSGATANLNIAGTAICSNSIVKGTLNLTTNNIDLSNGKLTMVSGVIGTPAAPIDTLTLASSTLTLPVLDGSTNVVVNTLTLNDSSSVINFSSLPVLTAYPSVLPVITYTSLGAAGSVSLGTLPGTFKGYLTNDTSNFGVYLVVTNGPALSKVDQWVGNLSSTWDTSALNWTSSGTASAYAENDSVAFDDTASTGTVNYTTTHTPFTMTFNNGSLAYTLGGTGKISGSTSLVQSGSGTTTLTASGGDDFSGGITVNAGTVVLDNPNSAISGPLTVASGATFQVGSNDVAGNIPSDSIDDGGTIVMDRSDNVGLNTAITGGGSLVQAGSGMLTLSNANTYTGNTTVSGGTLVLAGAGSVANSSFVTVNNATLDLSSLPSGTSTPVINLSMNNATLNLNASSGFSAPLTVSGTVSMSGANTINLSALPTISTYPVTITLVQTVSGVSGFNATVGLPAATPAYQGTLQVSPDTTQIQLKLTAGPVGTRTAVLWTGADLQNLNTNWSDALNWQLPGAPGPDDNVIFGSAGVVFDSLTVDNVVDANTTVNTLQFTNTTSGQYHVTQIPTGVTLTVSSNMTVGGLTVSSIETDVAMTGGGTLNVGGNALDIGNNGTGGSDKNTVLDLSGLSNFVYNVPGGTLALGIGNRSMANLILANASNYITATNFNDNTTSSSSSGTGNVTLGSGTNIFNVANFNIGAGRSGSTVSFPDVTGGIRVRGIGGTDSDRAEMTIGNRNNGGGSGNSCNGVLSLNGHSVDMKLDVLTMGESGSNPTSNDSPGNGTLSYDAGTVDVNGVVLARSTGSTSVVNASGTINLGSAATLIVGTGGVNLGDRTGSSGPATGTLNIGGTTICAGNIVKSTASASGNVTVTNGGTLKMLSGVIGTPDMPIDLLTLDTGTLQLSVDGSSPVTNIVATTVSAANTTTINIGSVANVTAPATVSLISYMGTDPFPNLVLGTLPAGVTATLVDDTANATIDLNITSAPASNPPTIQSISVVGGNIVISGTNNTGSSGTFHVLTSTNLNAPLANWTVVTNGSFNGGNFSTTNAIDPTQPMGFYIIQLP